MKTYLFALVTFFALVSCEEENPQPVNYSGVYVYESADLEIYLELTRDYGVYKGTRASVDHEAITSSEGNNTVVIVRYDESEELKEEIIIRSPVPVVWSVTLSKVRFTGEGMNVEQIRVMMPDRETVLKNQFVRKLNL